MGIDANVEQATISITHVLQLLSMVNDGPTNDALTDNKQFGSKVWRPK